MTLCDQPVEIVKVFKYLGTMIDCKLHVSCNVDFICKKANQRLYLLRKLREFSISQGVLQRVYISLIERVLGYDISAWFGRIISVNKLKLKMITRMASKIIEIKQKSIDQLYDMAVRMKALAISGDTTHTQIYAFELLASGRHYRTLKAIQVIYKQTFAPYAINLLNKG